MRVNLLGSSVSSMLTLSTLTVIVSMATAYAFSQVPASVPANPLHWSPTLTSDGQPDLQGFWRASPGGDTYDLTGAYFRPDVAVVGPLPQGAPGSSPSARRVRQTVDRVADPADGKIPYQPWAAAKQKDLAANIDNPTKPEHIDTQAHCLPAGPGRVFIHSGFQILQAPGYVFFFTEENDESRVIPLDGRPHIGQDIRLWQGDSRGHWEGNTLVIDVTNLKAKSRLDVVGNFYSPAAHFVERLTFADDKTINYEATITDPTVYTRPWKLTAHFVRGHMRDEPDGEMWEDACHEGERSADRMIIPANIAKQNAERAKRAKQLQQ